MFTRIALMQKGRIPVAPLPVRVAERPILTCCSAKERAGEQFLDKKPSVLSLPPWWVNVPNLAVAGLGRITVIHKLTWVSTYRTWGLVRNTTLLVAVGIHLMKQRGEATLCSRNSRSRSWVALVHTWPPENECFWWQNLSKSHATSSVCPQISIHSLPVMHGMSSPQRQITGIWESIRKC